MGRPSLLSDEVQARLVEAFNLGQVSIATACAYAGIAERTYYVWMAKGREGQEPYEQFMQAIEKARADAVMINLAVIRKAAQAGHWQAAAWWLERVLPAQYGRKTQVEVITLDLVESEIRRLEAELDASESRPALPSETTPS